MNEYKISVIIPAYNSEKTILRALESVNSQTFKPIEIIVINDYSSDKTEEVVKSFKSEITIIFLSNETNKGPSYSRNRGIRSSNGNWIAFLDADDYWHPQKLEFQIKLHLRQS